MLCSIFRLNLTNKETKYQDIGLKVSFSNILQKIKRTKTFVHILIIPLLSLRIKNEAFKVAIENFRIGVAIPNSIIPVAVEDLRIDVDERIRLCRNAQKFSLRFFFLKKLFLSYSENVPTIKTMDRLSTESHTFVERTIIISIKIHYIYIIVQINPVF